MAEGINKQIQKLNAFSLDFIEIQRECRKNYFGSKKSRVQIPLAPTNPFPADTGIRLY